MGWTLVYTASAAKAIRNIDPDVRRRVHAALQRLREEPTRGKPLGLSLRGLRSWRTGDYRIVYRLVETRIVVLIVAVGHRRDVYEKLRSKW